MDCPHEESATAVRSVFLSDAHLGSPYSQADALLAFLNSIEPKYLYLVGDIVEVDPNRWTVFGVG